MPEYIRKQKSKRLKHPYSSGRVSNLFDHFGTWATNILSITALVSAVFGASIWVLTTATLRIPLETRAAVLFAGIITYMIILQLQIVRVEND